MTPGFNLSQDQNGWTLETFRFEDENDYEYEIWLHVKDFLHILKNGLPEKLHFTIFH